MALPQGIDFGLRLFFLGAVYRNALGANNASLGIAQGCAAAFYITPFSGYGVARAKDNAGLLALD